MNSAAQANAVRIRLETLAARIVRAEKVPNPSDPLHVQELKETFESAHKLLASTSLMEDTDYTKFFYPTFFPKD